MYGRRDEACVVLGVLGVELQYYRDKMLSVLVLHSSMNFGYVACSTRRRPEKSRCLLKITPEMEKQPHAEDVRFVPYVLIHV